MTRYRFPTEPPEVGTIQVPILQMRTLGLGEVEVTAPRPHISGRWSWDLSQVPRLLRYEFFIRLKNKRG